MGFIFFLIGKKLKMTINRQNVLANILFLKHDTYNDYITFILGFVIRGYIIDHTHNKTLINHSEDVLLFLKKTKKFKEQINLLRFMNRLLEKRILKLIKKFKSKQCNHNLRGKAPKDMKDIIRDRYSKFKEPLQNS